jgi:hypothetical protein
MNNPGLITHVQGPSTTFSLATRLSVGPVFQTTIAFVMQQLEQGLCKSEMNNATNWPSCVKRFDKKKRLDIAYLENSACNYGQITITS